MQTILPTPIPRIKTHRLLLRPLLPTDVEAITALRSHPQVNYYLDRPSAISQREASEFIDRIVGMPEGQSYYWAITLAEAPDPIGIICFWNFSEDHRQAELGYEMLPAFWGRGYMQEAASRVLEYGRGVLRLELILAYTHEENERSIRLLEKNGFLPDSLHQYGPVPEATPEKRYFLLNRKEP